MKIASAIVALLLIAGGVYYFAYYPPTLMKRATRDALDQFAAAVATKDRAKIGESLQALLTDDAKVKLEVRFFTIGVQVPPMVQEFDKPGFIHFIDTVLYPMTDYFYEPKLESFESSADRQSAAVQWSSNQWADGNAYFGGAAVEMRFSSVDASCRGEAAFSEMKPRLRLADCGLTLMRVPKPGQESKLRGEALRDLLIKQ